MKNTFELPKAYKKCLTVEFENNHKLSLLIFGLALFICIAMLVPVFIYSKNNFINISDLNMPIMVLVTAVGVIAYISLHKFIRGIFIRIFSGKKANYTFNGIYSSAGSECYFNKKSYTVIELAAVVILGIILAVMNFIVPPSWFMVVYLIQAVNIGGSAKNYYIVLKLMELSKDILIKNSGTAMTVFDKEG